MNFKKLRPKIEAELEKRIPNFDDDFILINGFINSRVSQAADELTVGGPIIPMVMVIERSSGKVNLFAFKHFEIEE